MAFGDLYQHDGEVLIETRNGWYVVFDSPNRGRIGTIYDSEEYLTPLDSLQSLAVIYTADVGDFLKDADGSVWVKFESHVRFIKGYNEIAGYTLGLVNAERGYGPFTIVVPVWEEK